MQLPPQPLPSSLAAYASKPIAALLSALSLSQERRILQVTFPDTAPEAVRRLVPLQLEGEEAVCGGVRYRLQTLGDDSGLPLKDLQGLPVAVSIGDDRGGTRIVCGIVTEVEQGASDGSGTVYEAQFRDALSILAQRYDWRPFTDLSVVEITEQLLNEQIQDNPILRAAFRFSTKGLRNTYPQRAFTMHAGESLMAYLIRLWKQEGISWFWSFALEDGHPVHTLCLADHVDAYPANPMGTVRYQRADATEKTDTIVALRSWRTLSPGSVLRRSWEYQDVRTTEANDPTVLQQGKAGDALASTLVDYGYDAPRFGADASHYGQQTRCQILACEYTAKGWRGEGVGRLFVTATHVGVSGHPELDTHPEEERRLTITRLQVYARNSIRLDARLTRSLFQGWAHVLPPEDGAAQPGGSPTPGGRPSEAPVYYNRFEAVRRDTRIMPLYDPEEVPRVGMLSAIVVSENGSEVDVDEQGRILVAFPFTRPEHAPRGAGRSHTARIRAAHPWAAAGFGAALWPRAGSELLVAFIQGHPDKPIALPGAVYNGTHAAPRFSGVGSLPGNAALNGLRSQEWAGTGFGELLFDDTTGQTRTKLSSEHGSTQLNQGFITTARIDGKAQRRGEGFEIVSRLSGVVRAALLLLTTHLEEVRQGQAQSPTLERQALIGELEAAGALLRQAADLAATHQAGGTDLAAQEKLLAAIQHWDTERPGSGAAAIALSALEGIVAATAANIQWAAGSHVDVSAQQDINLTSGRKCVIRALQGFSVFARQDMRLIAGTGDVTLQAQAGKMEIGAAKETLVYSLETLVGRAKNIVLEAEGARITLANGKITLEAASGVDIKAPGFNFGGSYAGSPDLPDMPASSLKTNERMALANRSGAARENLEYTIKDAQGGVMETGASVADGATQSLLTDTEIKSIALHLKP